MKPLVKVMLILGSIFALTFIVGRLLGILTVENVRQWLELAAGIDPFWLAGTVVFLLFLDLFVAVPTLSITILAGFFLGFPAGAAAATAEQTAPAAPPPPPEGPSRGYVSSEREHQFGLFSESTNWSP